VLCYAVLCCAVLCCAVLCCCAVLVSAVYRVNGGGNVGRPSEHTPADALGLVVHWLTTSIAHKNLSQVFGMPPTRISETLSDGLWALSTVLRTVPEAAIRWPTEEEKKEFARQIYDVHHTLPNVWGVIDGTKVFIHKPGNPLVQVRLCAMLCCAVLCCAVLCCVVLCCADSLCLISRMRIITAGAEAQHAPTYLFSPLTAALRGPLLTILDHITTQSSRGMLCCAVPCCAVLCCAVLCCAVLCCAVLCCAVLRCTVLCCAVLRCAVLCCAVLSRVCL
jgi:hypothetical protein